MHETFFTNMSRYVPDLYYWPERGILYITPFCQMWVNLEEQKRKFIYQAATFQQSYTKHL